jgi:capsular polysaccharide export protein
MCVFGAHSKGCYNLELTNGLRSLEARQLVGAHLDQQRRPASPPERGLAIGVFSAGVRRIEHLEEFLDAREILYRPSARRAAGMDCVVGWGLKDTAEQARRFADRLQKPYLRLEDGFFRSIRTGKDERTLSLVVDDLGIYYDSSRPSRLESFLNAAPEDDPLLEVPLLQRARAARKRVLEAGLSKYNDAPVDLPDWLRDLSRPYVLVVDQTYGDLAVKSGNMPEDGFERMLEAAEREHPDAVVVIKTHPEVARGKKRGYLPPAAHRGQRVRVLAAHTSPLGVVAGASQVYVGTSQLGFEALLLGKKVSCFGAPFYSGWGLTDDRVITPRRTRKRSIDELAAAAWILYPRYVHPVRGERCELEDVLSHLELQRECYRKNAGVVRAYGFTWWKRPFVRSYLGGPSTELHFERRLAPDSSLPPGTTRAVVWGKLGPKDLARGCHTQGVPLVRMEDGFLRSVGLGADLTAPASLVLDERGMYFDPGRPSDLEYLLEHRTFSAEEKERARALRECIVAARLSKYNPQASSTLTLEGVEGRRVLLLPGQVDDDESVMLGGAGIDGNLEFVRAVRSAHPHAYLLYRPHPDVLSGNRRGALSAEALRLVDCVASGSALEDCFAVADEVHTLTSLVGFEALLRGIPVSVYGQPFYSGWGLTTDRLPTARRTRRLELDELVAGALLLYPRYYSFTAKAFVTAEDVVFELRRDRETRSTIPLESSWTLRQIRKVLGWSQEVRRAR